MVHNPEKISDPYENIIFTLLLPKPITTKNLLVSVLSCQQPPPSLTYSTNYSFPQLTLSALEPMFVSY